MMFGLELTTWIDAVIAFTVIQMLLLCTFHRVTGRGLPIEEFLINMVSGLCLMLALRALASGASNVWVMAGLTAAGLAHGADLWRRWRKHEANALNTSPDPKGLIASSDAWSCVPSFSPSVGASPPSTPSPIARVLQVHS